MLARYKKGIIVAVAIIIALGGGVACFKFLSGSKPAANTAAAIASQPLLAYPEGWEELTLESSDAQAGIMLRARHTDPTATVVITVSQGTAQDTPLKSVANSIVKSFEKEVDSFKLVKKDVTKIGEYDAITIQYTQDSKGRPTGNIQAIIPSQKGVSKTYFLNYQAAESDFSKIEGDAVEINSRFVDYISSHAK